MSWTGLSCPWLVINHGEKQDYCTQTFVDIAHDHCDVVSIPEMLNMAICTSAHGWLVLLDFGSNVCFLLINPVSMEKIMLPNVPPAALLLHTCILSAPPTDPECVIILVRDNRKPCLFSSAWRKCVDRTILEIWARSFHTSYRVQKEDLQVCFWWNSSDSKGCWIKFGCYGTRGREITKQSNPINNAVFLWNSWILWGVVWCGQILPRRNFEDKRGWNLQVGLFKIGMDKGSKLGKSSIFLELSYLQIF